jgi:hypothetical protein
LIYIGTTLVDENSLTKSSVEMFASQGWWSCVVLVASFSFTKGTQDHPQDKRNVTAMDAVVYANNKQGNVYCSPTTTRKKL